MIIKKFLKCFFLNGLNSRVYSPNVYVGLFLLVVLAGCSSVPDSLNPVEWYKGAGDLYESAKNTLLGENTDNRELSNKSERNELESARNTPAPGSDQPFPSLGTVPERPANKSFKNRQKVANALIAENKNTRKYSQQVVRRQGEIGSDTNTLVANRTKLESKQDLSLTPQRTAEKESLTRPSTRSPGGVVAQAPQEILRLKPPPSPPKIAKVLPPKTTVKKDAGSVALTKEIPRLAVKKITQFDTNGTILVSGSGVENIGNADFSYSPRPYLRAREEQRPTNNFVGTGEDRQSYQVATILFANGSSALKPSDKRILRKVVAHNKEVGGDLRIVGHASSRTVNLDSVRHKLVNFEISAARADAVRNALVRLGSEPERLYVAAASDGTPKYRETMPSGEAGNRRAEIFVVY